MRTPRIHLAASLAPGERIALPAEIAHKLGKVLRLAEDSPLVLFNGDGRDYHGRLRWSQGRAFALLEGCEDVRSRESPLAVTLLQGLARGEKMDWIVQKCTELGVRAILPLACERSEVRLEGERRDRRLEHWQAVASAACEQCGRAVLPEIHPPLPLSQLDRVPLPPQRLLLTPEGERLSALGVDQGAAVALAVGPEGGFSPAERQWLSTALGFRPWRLGPRILRTETAGLAALAALQTLHGDFGR